MKWIVVLFTVSTTLLIATKGGRLKRNPNTDSLANRTMCSDLCQNTPNLCGNFGTCSFNGTNCQYVCTCQDGFDGTHCENITLRPFSERQCSPSLVCRHGYCKESKCLCDVGWQGPVCDTIGKCQPQCNHGKECILVDSTYMCTVTKTTAPSTTMVSHTTHLDYQQSEIANASKNACSPDYEMRPIPERMCLPNFICKYGRCVTKKVMNSVSFTCSCDEGAVGGLCHNKCCLKCAEHGICKIHANETRFCNCKMGYVGKFCELKIGDPNSVTPGHGKLDADSWHYWVIGVVLSLVLIALLLIIVVTYCMWKAQVMFAMKIIHHFQRCEDEDGKTWDVYISYKPLKTDENFVLQTLFPKLEEEFGYKVCLRPRDFVPWDAISNNIDNEMNNSRRTVVIFTPRHVLNEHQFLQLENLARKHHIIAILLKDGSCTMNLDLRKLNRAVTCIEYPDSRNDHKQPKFWERLGLMLPKKCIQRTK